jgi:tellurite resistance protein
MSLIGNAIEALAKPTQEVAPDDFALDAMVMAVSADGEVQDEEIVYAHHLARQLPTLADATTEEVGARILQAFDRLKSDGWEARMAAVAQAARAARSERELLAFAVTVQYADGVVSEEEDAMIDQLARALGLSDADVQAVIDGVEAQLGIPTEGAEPPSAAKLPESCQRCDAPVKMTFRGRVCPFCDASLV